MKKTTLLSLVLALFLAIACGDDGKPSGTSTGNYVVSINFKAYTRALVREAFAVPSTVSSLTFCFKRLRFKMENENSASDVTTDDDNIDFELGEVTIDASGTFLGAVKPPAGTYKRIEFDLEDGCTSGKSVQMTNSNGTFSTDDRITIKFEGTFVMGEADTAVDISLQSIIDALDSVNADDDIRSQAESVNGSY